MTDPQAKLVELGRAVAHAATIDEVMSVITDVAGPLLKATNATALLLDESKSRLVVHHGPAATTAAVRVVELTDPTPAAEVVRTGEPVFVGSLDELCDRYPRFVEQLEKPNWSALAVLPLLEADELFGVVVYRWISPVDFTPAHRELVVTASELVAAALARARNHDRLLAYARRLRDANQDLDSFAAAVAHDLRQPMRQLRSYVDLLLESVGEDRLDGEGEHYAQRIRVAVERADRLIVALLDYARAGGKPMLDQEVRLGDLAREVVDALRARLDEANAVVSIEELPIVEGDAALLHQALQNLIDNAAKYRHPDRCAEIVVSAVPEPAQRDGAPWWRISVRDNGVGIATENHAKVFDLFTRSQQGAKLSGSGIGLATAKRAVERHGGTIGVESTPGEGSTFWFTVPGVAGRHHY